MISECEIDLRPGGVFRFVPRQPDGVESPFYEDPLDDLRDLLGTDHILMGSDYPHAEGLAEPASYLKDLQNFAFTDEQARAVMRDNGIGLSKRRPA